MIYVFYTLGIVLALIVIFFGAFIWNHLNLKMRKPRRRWALSIGLPARLANKDAIRKRMDQENMKKSSISDADADIHLELTVPNIDEVKKHLGLIGFDFSKEDAINQAEAKARIFARFTNQQSQYRRYELSGFSVKDTIAWDASMLVEEVRIAATFKWIDKEEAWGLIFLNAQRVQDTFKDWRDFANHCMRGRELEALAERNQYLSPRVSEEINMLFEDRDSAFCELAWRDFEIMKSDDIQTA